MKFSCTRDDLLKEISIAQEVISSRNSLSVLSNVLLTVGKRGLKIQATDLKVGFETSSRSTWPRREAPPPSATSC